MLMGEYFIAVEFIIEPFPIILFSSELLLSLDCKQYCDADISSNGLPPEEVQWEWVAGVLGGL